ncbi:MAG TPA: AAA family ATPase, partial [Ruminococcus flavefaciens]|nr:AAA family ATPase [Ruminococcus flavefaciens]
MGILLNPNNTDFEEATNAEIYVDKTELIAYANKVIRTPQKYICVSRPRRFGKSMAANMLTAYYSKECDSRELFKPYKTAKSDSFEKYLNKYNVIHINMVEYANHGTVPEAVNYLSRRLLHELKRENGDVDCFDWNDLTSVLAEIFEAKRVAFVFIIDEWDCIFRQKDVDKNSQTFYLNFLRNLLKDKSYVALAYMTGILPIKKYGEHSAINMFTEVSMTNAKPIAEFTGFTEDEVKVICEKYNKDFDEMKRWYDGYCLDDLSIYNPKSAVESVVRNAYSNYWTSTETYEALKEHIQLNFDGLKDKVTKMIAGESVGVNTAKFQNDMTSLNSADDVLTLLVHLGYLTFKATNETGYGQVWIPNSEVRQEF